MSDTFILLLCILQFENGRELVNQVVSFWPELKEVHCKPKPQPKPCVCRTGKPNQDIESTIATWMKDNKTSKLSEDL